MGSTFPERLRAARIGAGLSVSDLARLARVSRPYLYQLESPARSVEPSAAVVLRLATALGIDPTSLMDAVAASADGAIPDSLRSYLESGQSTPASAGILEVIARRIPGEATAEDWQFLDGALRRTVLRSSARRRRPPEGA